MAEPAKALPGKEPAKEPADDVRMSFGDHLDELRRRVIYALIGLVLAVVACIFFAESVVTFLCQPLVVALRMAGLPPQLYQEKVPQLFLNYMEMAALAGAILASPWILYQLWMFVAAGLYHRERNAIKKYGVMSLVLFAAGAAFVYFMVVPFALKYFVSFSQDFKPPDPKFLTPIQRLIYSKELNAHESPSADQPPAVTLRRLDTPPPYDPKGPSELWIDQTSDELQFYDSMGQVRSVSSMGNKRSMIAPWFNLDEYLSFMISMMLMFGIGFQMPLVILFLAATGLVPSDTLRKSRRAVIMIIVVVAAVLNPATDAISMTMLAIPLVGLFELGLVMGRRAEQRKKLAAE